MFLNLVDRLWTPTLLYILISSGIYSLRNTAHHLFVYGVLAAATIHYARRLTKAIVEEHKIDRLGKHAPSSRTWTPWNLLLIFRAIWYFSHHRNHEWWWNNFKESGNKNIPWTVEAITVGDRIIFTADEENIKAILATQFSDYGKGPQFQKEWKPFLGLSIFTTDGEMWHNSRTLLRPQFIKDRVSDLHTFETHIRRLLPLLAGSHNGATVRADDLFYRFGKS